MHLIEQTVESVRYWSNKRLQLPRRSFASAGYKELQGALLALRPHEGRILACRYWSNEPRGGFDVENVLIYNPSPSNLSHASQNGISFSSLSERPPLAPDGNQYGHLNEYAFRRATYPDAKQIIESFSFPLASTERAKVWQFASSSLSEVGENIVGEFGLHVSVFYSRSINPARQLKQLFDGIITALQSDESPSDEVVYRLTTHLGVTSSEVQYLLSGRKPRLSVLSRRNLVGLTANGFVLNPADHLCTEGTLVSTFGDEPRCVVTIYKTAGFSEATSEPRLDAQSSALESTKVSGKIGSMNRQVSQFEHSVAHAPAHDGLDAFVVV